MQRHVSDREKGERMFFVPVGDTVKFLQFVEETLNAVASLVFGFILKIGPARLERLGMTGLRELLKFA
jgi:hypothetical protein